MVMEMVVYILSSIELFNLFSQSTEIPTSPSALRMLRQLSTPRTNTAPAHHELMPGASSSNNDGLQKHPKNHPTHPTEELLSVLSGRFLRTLSQKHLIYQA